VLKLRVITAVLLLAVLLPCLLAPSPWPFALLCAVFTSAAAWEWARLSGCGGLAAWGAGAIVAASVAAMLAVGWQASAPGPGWAVVLVLWVLGSAWALRAGASGWAQVPQAARLAVGWLLLAVTWLSFVQGRALGVAFFLSAAAVVWVSDVSAYFAGRRWGRHKLAPTISPGKTWEGVAGAVLGVLLVSAGWLQLERSAWLPGPSLHALLWDAGGPLLWTAGLALLTALGIVGDLMESLVKRASGAKDSSQLLPGHGGVLDRIDALLPVMPAALALAWAVQAVASKGHS
jgi:phosphatidate cytidylyltransferase